MELKRIQQALRAEKLDGWLFFDFRKSNPVAYRVLSLSRDEMYTRRWFYYVPREGLATAVVSAVEPHVLRTLPGNRLFFRSWQELHTQLRSLLKPEQCVAMEYSPLNAIPSMSCVDAGTLELISSFGVDVVSSANLAQRFVAQLTAEQLESHRTAGRLLIAAKDQLFSELSNDLRQGLSLDEYRVQRRFVELIKKTGLQLDESPLVAVNRNASNPHYVPTATSHSPIQRGDLVLFDFWAHLPQPNAIFADYTWMAFVGTQAEIPAEQRSVFELVRSARDAGIAFTRERLQAGERVQGRQVDDVVRSFIAGAGYGGYFIHRTGHSIDTAEHGDGANLDNFETHDTRLLLPDTCCSIEPGIYLPEFGIRSEVNLLLLSHDVEVTGVPVQQAIVPLLS